MIASRSSFNLALFFSLFLLTACRLSTDTLQYATIYHGHSVEGFHARSITFVNSEAVILAGPAGKFCGKYFSGELIEQPVVAGAEDLRDIHLFNNGTMVLMSSGDTGRIFVIGYNGEQGKVLDTPGVFLDGMDFWDELNGIVYGDPVGGSFFLARTKDGGRSWKAFTPDYLPAILPNEAGFAASGTGLQCIGDSTVLFATGMADTARIFISHDRGMSWTVKNTPVRSGDSFGIFSMTFWNEKEGMIAGGSWQETEYRRKICFYTPDGGETWINRSKGLGGYTSCIVSNEEGTCIFATGDQGTYFTLDKGLTWGLLVARNYYSMAVNKDFVALCGRDGVLEILRYKF